jgi:formate hydrogenlyase transcriptional activator
MTDPDHPLSILCVDDDQPVLASLYRLLRREARVVTATSGEEALALLAGDTRFGVILSDHRMPGMDGTTFLAAAATLTPDTPRILLTGHADLQIAQDAVNRGGASRIIFKPWEDHDIIQTVRDSISRFLLVKENRQQAVTITEQRDELARCNDRLTAQVKAQTEKLQRQLDEITKLEKILKAENIQLRAKVNTHMEQGKIIGNSLPLKKVLSMAERVAPTGSTVLILGETGTGKELLAQFIHQNSPRSGMVLHKINCAAIPENLVESELFGREKGAYTGAVEQQIGHFELADGSTILLDEVGELPFGAQAKLLRVLQEGEFERLGSPLIHRTNVRVIAATNRDLLEEVRQGRFREDLYYRLNVFPLKLPLLRERPDDIPLLVDAFIKELGDKMGRTVNRVTTHDREALQRYSWPGNIRELHNIIEHALIFSSGDTLQVTLPENQPSPSHPSSLSLHEVERSHITTVLESTGWRVHGESGAARILGLNPNTLFFRMKKLDIPLLKQKQSRA